MRKYIVFTVVVIGLIMLLIYLYKPKTIDKSIYVITERHVILYEPDTGESHWAPKRCVDCTIFGTKEKPTYWPNNHQ